MTFASGAHVGFAHGSIEPTRPWAKCDLEETDSREVMGFVRWESGAPAPKAVVFMQNTYNFRKYVRRVETDEHGYFRFIAVPGGEPYFVFAVPPGQTAAMRNLDYFGVAAVGREVSRDQVLHPHRISGTLIRGISAAASLQLVRIDGKADATVWTFRADSLGRFAVENVSHGRYRVQVSQVNGRASHRSLAFEVGDGRDGTTVEWPSGYL